MCKGLKSGNMNMKSVALELIITNQMISYTVPLACSYKKKIEIYPIRIKNSSIEIHNIANRSNEYR